MNNDCRDEFSRFMYGDEEPTTRFDVQNEVKQHWKTWQAAWAVATKAAIKNQGEPVVYWNGLGAIIPADDVSYLPNWSDYYPIPLYTSAPTIPEGWQQATHANAPKYGERVIVLTTDADGDPIPEFAHYNGELGFLGIGGKRIKPVSYWMPSPAAPKGDKP